MTRDQIVAEARKWDGVRYRDQGRSMRGVDCLGLLVMIGRALAVPHVDEPGYKSTPSADLLILRRLSQDLIPIAYTDTPLPGTVGVFAEARLPGHVGIFTVKHGMLHLVHARMIPARVVEEPWNAVLKDSLRLIGLFAFPGVED
jgi:cell wall-associated NlpC family hydrolase